MIYSICALHFSSISIHSLQTTPPIPFDSLSSVMGAGTFMVNGLPRRINALTVNKETSLTFVQKGYSYQSMAHIEDGEVNGSLLTLLPLHYTGC